MGTPVTTSCIVIIMTQTRVARGCTRVRFPWGCIRTCTCRWLVCPCRTERQSWPLHRLQTRTCLGTSLLSVLLMLLGEEDLDWARGAALRPRRLLRSQSQLPQRQWRCCFRATLHSTHLPVWLRADRAVRDSYCSSCSASAVVAGFVRFPALAAAPALFVTAVLARLCSSSKRNERPIRLCHLVEQAPVRKVSRLKRVQLNSLVEVQ